jgi:hypothetical protein
VLLLLVLVLREAQSEEDGDLYAPQSAGLESMCKMLLVSFSDAVVAPSAFGMFHAKAVNINIT